MPNAISRRLAILIYLSGLLLTLGACAEGAVESDPDATLPGIDAGRPDLAERDDADDAGDDDDADLSTCVPSAETCNGVDDDCDGQADEDFEQLGSACTGGVGACEVAGTLVCGDDGEVACDAVAATPADELCGNGIDDDCDGDVDEGFVDVGATCASGEGACAAEGLLACSDDGLSLECDATPLSPGDELCGNGVDDDCDGDVDEGFVELGTTCTVGQGSCAATGQFVCSADGLGLVCDAVATDATAELCGNGVDDDCDGDIDEGFEMRGMACSNGTGACSSTGTFTCSSDLTSLVCDATPGQPSAEICGNGIDEDCNGTADDGFPDLGTACQTTLGTCTASGTLVCDGTGTTCDAVVTPQTETCDGVDQDCDGDVDEDAVCGACADDTFEVNDFRDAAAPLDPRDRRELVSCFTDPDWYELGPVAAGEVLVINSTFVDLIADLDLILHDPSGTVVAASTSSTDDEQIVHTAATSGDYTLLVRQFGPKASQSYTLYWDRRPSTPVCIDDPWEPNDTLDTAVSLPTGRTISAEICGGNLDYYDLGFLTRGFGVEILLDHVAANGDLDMRLYRYGSEVATALTLADLESIVFWPEFGGEYTVVVEGDASLVTNDYTLSARFAGPFVCTGSGVDIVAEPDDGPSDADTIFDADGREAAICGTDDWIRIRNLAVGEIVVASIFFEHDVGDLDLWVWRDVGPAGPYDPTNAVAASRSTDDNEQVRFTVPAGGDYLAMVEGFSGSRARYRFAWDELTAACDDPFEPNDKFGSFPTLASETSARLSPSTTYAANLCSGDVDNFELGPFAAGRRIEVTVSGDVGNFEVELFDGTTSVAIDSGNALTKTVIWTTTDDDDHTLAIRPLGGASVSYDVSYEVF